MGTHHKAFLKQMIFLFVLLYSNITAADVAPMKFERPYQDSFYIPEFWALLGLIVLGIILFAVMIYRHRKK